MNKIRSRSGIITLKFNIFCGSIYGIHPVPNSIAWSLVKRYFMGRYRFQWESLHQYCFFKEFFCLKLLWSKTFRSAFLVAEVTSAFSIFRSHQSNLSSNIYQSHLARFKWLFCFVFSMQVLLIIHHECGSEEELITSIFLSMFILQIHTT